MYLNSLASAFPKNSFTQAECHTALQEAPFWNTLDERSKWLLEKILTGSGGIEKRHFAIDSLAAAMTKSAEKLNNAYEQQAPALAADAVRKAAKKANIDLQDVDALFIASCTGYLCPGITSYVAEKLDLREDVFMQDMTGLGCGAAVPLLRVAKGLLADRPDATVLTVAVEVCSAAFYVEDDFGVLISNCIFGDGAAACVWTGSNNKEQSLWKVDDFQSIHVPEDREKIRFTNAAGKLRNQLHRSVPTLAAETVAQLYERRNLTNGEPQEYITHGGGRDVIEALEGVLPPLSIQQEQLCENDDSKTHLKYAREVMRDYGNMSSPSVLVALEKFIESEQTPESNHLWMCAFGAGFSAHSCELTRS